MSDSEVIEPISLPFDLKVLIANNPQIFADQFRETSQAISLLEWPLIMAVQVDKAKRGDTTSAKFITDLLTPLLTTNEDSQIEQAIWESLAIELRDKLGLETSAEKLVESILRKLIAMDVNQLSLTSLF